MKIKINSTSFGKIVINERTYDYDVIVFPSGKIERRALPKGTHVVCLTEIEDLLNENPEIVVIGTGQYGIAKVDDEAKEEISSKARLFIVDTKEAIKIFNKFVDEGKKVAGLFHLTC